MAKEHFADFSEFLIFTVAFAQYGTGRHAEYAGRISQKSIRH